MASYPSLTSHFSFENVQQNQTRAFQQESKMYRSTYNRNYRSQQGKNIPKRTTERQKDRLAKRTACKNQTSTAAQRANNKYLKNITLQNEEKRTKHRESDKRSKASALKNELK